MTDYNPYDEIKEYSIGDTKTLKIGVIGDTQLLSLSFKNVLYSQFTQNFKKSLEVLKEKKINVLIIDGDITNAGFPEAYDNYLQQFNSVFGNEKKENIPILNLIMGNHDYWNINGYNDSNQNNIERQKLFEEKTKEKPFTHKIINGYHFINWSCENATLNKPVNNHSWFEEQIKLALENNDNKPIFVTTHFPPKNTVYGSQEWGDDTLNEYFKKYPQIINFSGHSHFSLIDERSIYQKDYTAIQTQSISYIELEKGKINGSVPKDEYDNIMISAKNCMGLICDVNENQVVIKRISFNENKYYGDDWIIDVPINKNNFRYLYKEMDKNSIKPYFIFEKEEDKKVIVEKNNNKTIIKFKQAFHPNFVHSYKIIFKNKNNKEYTVLYFSDFYLMPSDRKNIISLGLKNYLEGNYNVRIYAIESFGKISDNYIEDNIVIEEQ